MLNPYILDAALVIVGGSATMMIDIPFAYAEGFFTKGPHGTSLRQAAANLWTGLRVAVFEEAVFRFALFGLLTMVLPVWAAVILSAIVFGLSHHLSGWKGTMQVMAGVEGVINALAYHYSGTIIVPILIHALVVAAWFSFWSGEWRNV